MIRDRLTANVCCILNSQGPLGSRGLLMGPTEGEHTHMHMHTRTHAAEILECSPVGPSHTDCPEWRRPPLCLPFADRWQCSG